MAADEILLGAEERMEKAVDVFRNSLLGFVLVVQIQGSSIHYVLKSMDRLLQSNLWRMSGHPNQTRS